MLDFALGELGLLPDDFWNLTWGDYIRIRDGFFKRNEINWLHTRYLASIMVNINRDKKKRPVLPSDLVPLKLDKLETKKEFTPIKTQFSKEEIREIKIKHGILKPDGEHSGT